MNGLENKVYLIAYIISNAFALLVLFFSWRHIKLSRLAFVILFGWASWANWTTALNSPGDYLDYVSLSFFPLYKQFIEGWFSNHILLVVGFIATAQAFIAISLLLKGRIYKAGIIGGIIFLISIAPLGVGSAFPCTLLLALALGMIYKNHNEFILTRKIHEVQVTAD
jgi:hypothetical protein